MYTMFRSIPVRILLTTQAPAFLASFLIAEFFYKFKSFALECLAFLATWFVLEAVLTGLRTLLLGRRGQIPADSP